ncbi:hypothetical protein Vadar_021439 [Vaccinium darrowii]|uniref:Uncharacterized protein n=1 Tax=Vaccinium darrowii TaxID=229202 RepID=A0ACB7XJ27_9ERIC|nr:hypothetical protein Vadar_021439 [Vaccinium darrowii]
MVACSRMKNEQANWANLQLDLLTLIAKKVNFLEDFSAFRRVCRSWRSVAVKENFKGSQQLPWLMLAEENNTDYRGFVTATDGNLIGKLLLPEAKGKRCFESLGWLITLSETGDMNLLHPISQVRIPLPHVSTIPISQDCIRGCMLRNFPLIQKAVLSSCPCVSSKDNNYVLMVIHGVRGFLGFWKPGDKAWTTIETRPCAFMDITYYNDMFYAVNSVGKIFVCDVGGHDPTVAHVVGAIPYEIVRKKRSYIVESKGEVLVVVRDGYDNMDYLGDNIYEEEDEDEGKDECWGGYRARMTTEFRVFKVEVSNGEWVELQSLGDNALFVGYNASISIQAGKFQGIRPDCIYYTDDRWPVFKWFERGGKDMGIYSMEDPFKWFKQGGKDMGIYSMEDPFKWFKQGGKDMGIYSMEDRSVAPFHKGGSFSRFCPPLWVRPHF